MISLHITQRKPAFYRVKEWLTPMAMVPAVMRAVRAMRAMRLWRLLVLRTAAVRVGGAGHEVASEEVPIGLRRTAARMPGKIATHLVKRMTASDLS